MTKSIAILPYLKKAIKETKSEVHIQYVYTYNYSNFTDVLIFTGVALLTQSCGGIDN